MSLATSRGMTDPLFARAARAPGLPSGFNIVMGIQSQT